MRADKDMKAYKMHVKKRIQALGGVLASAAGGKFTLLKEDTLDEFAHLHSSLNLLLEAAQQKIEELNRVQAKNEAIIESVGEGLLVTDANRRIRLMNTRACKMFGVRDPKSVMGKSVEEVVAFENEKGQPVDVHDEKGVGAKRAPVGKRAASRRSHLYTRSKNGERHAVSVTISPVVMDTGKVSGSVSVLRDITEEERIDKAKGEFISLASHQLRTPLSIISLNLEILFKHHQAELEKGELMEPLRTIQSSVVRMIDLVSELLNVSKIEMGALDIVPEMADVGAVAAEAVKGVEALAAKKNITLEPSYPAQPLRLQTDPRMVRVLLDNLLSNAVKYGKLRGFVKLSVTRQKDGGAAITIADNGIGIPESQQNQIFSKLFRAENVKRLQEGGTGLGLYIVKSVTKALEGTVTFVSKEGKGTTFKVRLPKRISEHRYYGGDQP